MKQLINFSEQALALGYGLLDSHHLELQHDSVIEGLIAKEVKTAGKPKVQSRLAAMFQALQAKQAELTGIAESDFKALKQHKEHQERQKQGLAEQTDSFSLPTQSTAAPDQLGKTGQPNSCSRGADCAWRHSYVPNLTGAAWWDQNKPQRNDQASHLAQYALRMLT